MNRRFLAILIILSSAFLFATDGKPETYLEDHSDWWSLLNESLLDRQLQPREKEMAATSFAIAGITLDDDPLPQAMPKLGQATPVSRGDAATGRSQSCYVSSSGSRKTYLIFERGEVEYSFYLFTGGADWTGSNVCAKSRVELSDLSTPSGLKLGLSRAELESILGKPDLTEGNKIIYVRESMKKTSPKVFANFRKSYPDMPDKDLQENYGSYSLWMYVEARFTDSRVNYLAVSKSETF